MPGRGVLILVLSGVFVYNYTGICIGSIICLPYCRNDMGKPIVMTVFKEKRMINTSGGLKKERKFDKAFAAAKSSSGGPG